VDILVMVVASVRGLAAVDAILEVEMAVSLTPGVRDFETVVDLDPDLQGGH
jgi:hypothetical protein